MRHYKMEIIEQEDKVGYGVYVLYSRCPSSPSYRFFYIEDSDVRGLHWITQKEHDIDVTLTGYLDACNSTDRQGDLRLQEPDNYKHENPQVIKKGGVALPILASVKDVRRIKILFEAGAVPDKDYTSFAYGDNSEEWVYLHELYTEYLRRKRAKPASVVRESITP